MANGMFVDVCHEIFKSINKTYYILSIVRLGIMMSWASFGFVPYWMATYKILDKIMHGKSKFVSIVLKSALSVAIAGPPINAFFICATTALEYSFSMKSFEPQVIKTISQQRLEEKLPEVIQNSIKIWFPLNCINWGFISERYRIIFISTLSVFWNTYLSITQHDKKNHAQESKEHCSI